MNPFVKVPVPLVFVTTTLAVPAVPAGVTALMLVALFTTTPVAFAVPIFTALPAMKPVPVIVTAVPPAVDPRTLRGRGCRTRPGPAVTG